MTFFKTSAERARQVRVAPGGGYLILERLFLDQGGRALKADDVVDCWVVAAPIDDPEETDSYGFRPQDHLSNAFQLDGDWDVDGVGYNFRFRVPQDFLPNQGQQYKLEFVFQVLGDTHDLPAYEVRSDYRLLAGSGVWQP